MKLYVAGKWGDKDKVARTIKKLEAIGHTITHNWTLDHKFKSKIEEAIADKNGVKAAEVIIVFMDDIEYAYKGSWTEIGIAVGCDKPIYMITTPEFQKECKNVFFLLPEIRKRQSLVEVIGDIGTPAYDFDPKTHIGILKRHGFFDPEPTSTSPTSGEKWEIRYTNYKNDTRVRHIQIHKFYVGTTNYYPSLRVLISATDLDKNEPRVFAAASVMQWIKRL